MFAYLVEHNRYLNIVGIFVIIVIAILCSRNRSAINIRLALSALGLHFLLAYLTVINPWGKVIIGTIADAAAKISDFVAPAMKFVFGELANMQQGWGFIFAVQVAPVIIFVGALTALLFHWGIIQKVVAAISFIIRPLVGASGIETTTTIANSILGQTEAALFMSNYIGLMTRSELFVMMTSGMAAISIAVLVIYTVLGIPAMHLLAASIMSIPASLLIAKIIVPEEEIVGKTDRVAVESEHATTNSFDAISKGTMDGLKLAFAVLAMLISFLALLTMGDYLLLVATQALNNLLSYFQSTIIVPTLSISLIFSYLFAPFAYLLGFTGSDLWNAGALLGTKIATNELIAFQELAKITMNPRSYILMLYALCGFSNFSCIGIQIGMISALAPKQRHCATQLGLWAVFASTLANLLSAMIVGLLL